MRVEPSGIELDVAPGQTMFAAARAAGYVWPTICGGQGSCRTCFAVVLEGAGHLSTVEPWEQEGLDALGPVAGGGGHVRLACQARVSGPVVVRKAGLRLID